MCRVSGLLVTVRTGKQGAEMVCGKSTPKYLAEIAALRLHPDDLAALGLAADDRAWLRSAHGEAVVTCRPTEGPRGLFFLPLGAVANQLFSASSTNGTGVPDWKGLDVTLSPYEAPSDDGAQEGSAADGKVS